MNLAGAVCGGNNITEILRNGQRESLSFKQHRRNGDASDGDDDGDGSADDLTTASASVPHAQEQKRLDERDLSGQRAAKRAVGCHGSAMGDKLTSY